MSRTNIENLLKRNAAWLVSFGIVLVFLLPYLLLGTGSVIYTFDNFDSEFIYMHLLKINSMLFGFDGDTVLPNVMHGLPRCVFPYDFNVVRLFFYLLPSFGAYVVNVLVVRFLAFWGMYLLVRDYVLPTSSPRVRLLVAALFAIIPLYTMYGLAVAGQPLLFWSFQNLAEKKRRLVSMLVIFALPFYYHFALVGPFLLCAVMLYGVYVWRTRGTLSWWYLGGFVLFSIANILPNYLLIMQFVNPGAFLSHRVEMIPTLPALGTQAVDFLLLFFKGFHHATSFIALPLMVGVAYVLFSKSTVAEAKKKLILLIVLLFSICFFNVVYPWLAALYYKVTHSVLTFQFNRFTFLIPILWFLLVCLLFRELENKRRMVFLYIFLIFQVPLVVWQNKELLNNYSRLLSGKSVTRECPSFDEFFTVDQFADIKNFISKPQETYRVVSLGVYPVVALYNGFYSLDSYQPNYSLEFKHKFRSVIAGELAKSRDLQAYFDTWGSRCYVVSNELRDCNMQMCVKSRDAKVNNLSIDTKALKELGGEYIISAVEIRNAPALNISLEHVFKNKSSLWDIYLYKVL